ncbi:helix-turn-helix transcriptional regulator [Streptomyces sp. LN245]|uniref:helix-turn-helix transcriptional regulator n=1 Tax=Streptomyces sp. LN245 TaxID=3112975 RepID=UPI00371D3C5F
MTITDEDCLAETLEFNESFAATAASRPAREGVPDATLLAALRRNRLAYDAPPVRLPQGRDRVIAGGVKVRVFAPDPYVGAARTAAQKIAASMTGPAAVAAQELAARIVTLPSPTDSTVRAAVEQALTTNSVLRLSYVDAAGRESDRAVEPAGLLTADGRWYLIAWCRTRQAGRGFRLDRVTAAASTDEQAQPRDLTRLLLGSDAAGAVRPAALASLTPPPRKRKAPPR